MRDVVQEGRAHIAAAPLAIAVLMDGAKLPEIDGTRAIQNMVLAAWDLGVGSC
jgi:nitroreductase